jgi:hypothetical protein
MIKASICAFSAVLILAGCSDSKNGDIARNDTPATEPTPSEPEPKEEAKPAATTSATPDKPGEKSTEPSAPAPKVTEKPAKVAVSGTVWSVDRISVTTDDGIFSLPTGRQLRVVKHTPTGYVVTDEKAQFEVTEAQVSGSLATVTSTLQTAAAQHAAGAESNKAKVAAVQEQRAKAAVVEQEAAKKRKRLELQTRMEVLTREEAALLASLKRAEEQESRYRQARLKGGLYTKSISAAQEAAWNARLPRVYDEKNQILDEMARLQQ